MLDGVTISSYDNAHASRLTLVRVSMGMKGNSSFHFFSSQETIGKYKSEVRQQQLEKHPLGKPILLQNSKRKSLVFASQSTPLAFVTRSPVLWNLETRGSAQWLPTSLGFLLNLSLGKGKPTVLLPLPLRSFVWEFEIGTMGTEVRVPPSHYTPFLPVGEKAQMTRDPMIMISQASSLGRVNTWRSDHLDPSAYPQSWHGSPRKVVLLTGSKQLRQGCNTGEKVGYNGKKLHSSAHAEDRIEFLWDRDELYP